MVGLNKREYMRYNENSEHIYQSVYLPYNTNINQMPIGTWVYCTTHRCMESYYIIAEFDNLKSAEKFLDIINPLIVANKLCIK